jgi:hypothetical protein
MLNGGRHYLLHKEIEAGMPTEEVGDESHSSLPYSPLSCSILMAGCGPNGRQWPDRGYSRSSEKYRPRGAPHGAPPQQMHLTPRYLRNRRTLRPARMANAPRSTRGTSGLVGLLPSAPSITGRAAGAALMSAARLSLFARTEL